LPAAIGLRVTGRTRTEAVQSRSEDYKKKRRKGRDQGTETIARTTKLHAVPGWFCCLSLRKKGERVSKKENPHRSLNRRLYDLLALPSHAGGLGSYKKKRGKGAVKGGRGGDV